MSNDKNAAKKAMQEARKKRVKRIKRIIVAIIIIFLLLPSILCVSLWIRLSRLERKWNQYMEKYPVELVNADTEEEKEDGKAHAAEVEATEAVPTSEPEKEDQTLIEGKKVYLTFDDGPSYNTEEILDILKKYKVKATFFVIGQTDEHSIKMYKRICEEGHTLAMHSYSHQYDKIYKSVNAFAEDMDKLSDLLYGVTGERPHFIRFPGGSSNTVSDVDMKKFIRYANEKDYVYFDWNVINGDATGKELTNEEMIDSVVSNVVDYETSVVLMHDCAGKEQTVDILPTIIKKLKKEKVNMLPINDTTKLVQHIKADQVK